MGIPVSGSTPGSKVGGFRSSPRCFLRSLAWLLILCPLALHAETTYQLYVSGGTGTGKYAKGARVTIHAYTAPHNTHFTRWTGNGAPYVTNAEAFYTTLVMPAFIATVDATHTITNSPYVPSGYALTFDDEFTTLSIGETGTAGVKWFDDAEQCCMSDTHTPAWNTYMAWITAPAGENPFSLTANGLDIRLQANQGGASNSWYSGVLSTVDNYGNGFAQQYGYFEMKANLPTGAGTWPAFWMLSQAGKQNGTAGGETDMLESYMQFPTYINSTLHDWAAGTTPAYGQVQASSSLASGYHLFGMLWTQTTMQFFVDGIPVPMNLAGGGTSTSVPTPAIFNQPYYLLIDLGLGGGWDTTSTPMINDMNVQYVRVYAAQ